MAPAFQNTLTFNHNILDYRRIGFLKLDNAVSVLPKKSLFSPFIDTKSFFAMKIANYQDKQITPSESWDQDVFLAWFWGIIKFKL